MKQKANVYNTSYSRSNWRYFSLVAAIGITNTMYMSIYERTKEIGVIKVLGCFGRYKKNVFGRGRFNWTLEGL